MILKLINLTLAGTNKKARKNHKMPDAWAMITELVAIAQSKLPPEYQSIRDDLYDITFMFSGMQTPDHTDEWNGDGPGHFIMNLCLTGDGFFIFTDYVDEDAPFCGTYVGSNNWTGFTGHMRYAQTHQVK